MNANDTVNEISFRIRVIRKQPKYSQTASFCGAFLSRPCYGCRYPTHSLLRKTQLGEPGEGISIFEYECEAVIPEPLYLDNYGEEVNIQFELGAKEYARACNYDEDTTVRRLPQIIYNDDEGFGYPPHMDSFMNMVKLECRLHRGDGDK